MKLNLGCGRNYKKGFINIDLFDRTVCDRAVSITNLSFKDNSVELIEADQLIEHLGYVKSIYALSEWFRVLKPKGRLVIETPDIEKSFRKYLGAKDEKTKREVLNWLYGHESVGYNHVFCYDVKTLKDLLLKVGFENIKSETSKTHLYEHSIRIACSKPKKFQLYQTFANIRRKVRKEFESILGNQVLAMELELKLDIALISLKEMSVKKKALDETFILLSNYSPKLAEIVFKKLIMFGIIAKSNLAYVKLARKLILDSWVPKKYSALININSNL